MPALTGALGAALIALPRLKSSLAQRCAIAAAGLAAAALGIATYGRWIKPNLLKTTRARRNWRGPELRIAFLSDFHAGSTDAGFLRRAVARANEAHPHLILLGGDYIEGHNAEPCKLQDLEPLRGLRAPYGIFAVLGNHDTEPAGTSTPRAAAIAERLTDMGITILDNERQAVAPGVQLVGLGRYRAGNTDAGSAFAGRDPTRATIVLAHNWRSLEEPGMGRFDIAFAGHTRCALASASGPRWPSWSSSTTPGSCSRPRPRPPERRRAGFFKTNRGGFGVSCRRIGGAARRS
jgi:predicted MPP superfamily phosphohydrolase